MDCIESLLCYKRPPFLYTAVWHTWNNSGESSSCLGHIQLRNHENQPHQPHVMQKMYANLEVASHQCPPKRDVRILMKHQTSRSCKMLLAPGSAADSLRVPMCPRRSTKVQHLCHLYPYVSAQDGWNTPSIPQL